MSTCSHQNMKTREQENKKRNQNKIHSQIYQAKEEKKEQRKKKAKKRRERKKIEERTLQDRLLLSEKKVEELKMSLSRISEREEVSGVDHEHPQDPLENINDQPAKELEGEEEEVDNMKKMTQIAEIYLSDSSAVKKMTSLSRLELESLHEEALHFINMTTWHGEERKNPLTIPPSPTLPLLFFTLFWLKHYPTLSLLSVLFRIHEQTASRIIKRITTALAKKFENQIHFPSDAEFSLMMYTFGHNIGFGQAVCALDGTEIQISRPKNEKIQKKTWSGKKKQNSLNLMLMTKLNGEIIFYSPLRVGAHDQAHFNELNLQSYFLGKPYGPLADGGFTINQVDQKTKIKGHTPYIKPKGGHLTAEQKNYNTKLYQMQVVIENSICVIKTYRVLGGVYCHWRNGHGQINPNHVVTICVNLANQRILKKPLQDPGRMSKTWQAVFTDKVAIGPARTTKTSKNI